MRLSIALPCYNEVENIEATVADIQTWFREDNIDGDIIAVDDGSSDGTAELLDRLAAEHDNVTAIHHEVNQGYGSAVRTGLDNCTGDWIAFMDSDGQFKAEDFRVLIAETDRFDFVTGRKIKRADPFMRRLNAKIFAILVVLTLHVWVRDINCAMKMMKRSVWPTVRPRVATGALFNAEVFYRLRQNGIAWKQVFVHHYPRRYGSQTGAKLSVILTMFRDLMRLKRTEVRSA